MTDADKTKVLLSEYTEVCKAHTAITDFRAKLLAVLPIASGTGLFLLLKEQNNPLPTEATLLTTNLKSHLSAIGLFGFVATLGLFFQELRGIVRCWEIVNIGKSLEQGLGLQNGQFSQEHAYGSRFRIYGPEIAAWLIYPAMLAAWVYVAAIPLRWAWHLAILVLVVCIPCYMIFRKFAYKNDGANPRGQPTHGQASASPGRSSPGR